MNGGRGRSLACPAAGRSIRWDAEQLGHANPELTLRVYAHALPVDEADLAFADFGGSMGRTQAASEEVSDETARHTFGNLERETGFEPATLGLGRGKKRKK